MQLSKKLKILWVFYYIFGIYIKFATFSKHKKKKEKKKGLYSLNISETTDSKTDVAT